MAGLTRAQADSVLNTRLLPLSDLVTLNTAEAYTDAYDWALRSIGKPPASFGTVDDADLGILTNPEIAAFLDLSELRMMKTIEGNYKLVSIKNGRLDENWSDIALQLDRMIERKEESVMAQYGGMLDLPTGGAGRTKPYRKVYVPDVMSA